MPNKENEIERSKERYLEMYRQQQLNIGEFGPGVREVGESVVELLKKEGLTYQQAYAALQYSYNKLQYESNFVQLNQ